MKFNVYMMLGLAMIMVGLILPYTMAVYIPDDTPPEILTVVPEVDGRNYSPSAFAIQAIVRDVDSGIKSVTATIDGVIYTLGLSYKGSTSETWIFQTTLPSMITPGSHSISWNVRNTVDLLTTKTGTYTIYTALTGTWYINNIEITAATQKVYSQNRTGNFRFVKSSGLQDSVISCKVYEGTALLVQLTNVASGTWTGTYTFTSGPHTLQLKASDGYSTVIMGVITIDDSGSGWNFQFKYNGYSLIAVLGAILFAYGFLKQKKVAT